MFETLIKLQQEKTLSELVRRGLMSPAVPHQLEIVMFIDARMTADKKLSKTKAVFEASVSFNVSQSYVWDALKKIK